MNPIEARRSGRIFINIYNLPVYVSVVLTFAGEMAHLHGLVGINAAR